MGDDDQERFEDYLELERYIEELQAGKAAPLPQHLTPSQARIYRIAAQFCSASPGSDEPDEQFIRDLEQHLLDQLQEEQQETTEKRAAVVPRQEIPESESAAEPAPVEPSRPGKPARRLNFISRRAILAGGAVAAASLAIGTGIGEKLSEADKPENKPAATTTAKVRKYTTTTPEENYEQPWLVDSGPGNLPTTWHFVTTIAQLGNQAVQFAAGGVIGYVILKASNPEDAQPGHEVIAISAACTHMGCIVQWKNADRCFHCPCHNGLFTQNGLPDDNSPVRYLAALPRLRVRVENENIYVEVPKSV